MNPADGSMNCITLVWISMSLLDSFKIDLWKPSSIIDKMLNVATMKKIKNNNEEDPLSLIQFIVSYDMECHAGFNQGVV